MRIKTSFIIVFIIMAAGAVFAETPHEQFKQMVAQLQKTPTDNALREKIIKLARELKPAPAVPEEAERRMARGTAAFKGAKSVVDYRDAAKEFEQATLAAPWYGDAYVNLGVSQDKAENYEAALRSLKLALLALPNDKEIKVLIYEVEYRNEKPPSPEVEAARQAALQREKDKVLIKSLDGTVFVGPEPLPWNGSSDVRNYTTVYELHFHGNQVEFLARVVEQGSTRRTPGTILPNGSASLTGRHFTILSWSFDISPDGLSVSSDFGPAKQTFRKR